MRRWISVLVKKGEVCEIWMVNWFWSSEGEKVNHIFGCYCVLSISSMTTISAVDLSFDWDECGLSIKLQLSCERP